MPSGSSYKRPTGTVPKAKPPRKNSVPQEMVAPTRRDLQEHLNEFFASVAERATKPESINQSRTTNNTTDSCFDFDNLSLQENTRFCWPVRPIPRRNFIQDADMQDSPTMNLNLGGGSGNAAAVGVVMPTTPFHQDVSEQNSSHSCSNGQRARSLNQSSDGAIGATLRSDNTAGSGGGSRIRSGSGGGSGATQQLGIVGSSSGNVEDRISQIQEYIRITSNLINSIETEKSNPGNSDKMASLLSDLENLKKCEEKLLHLNRTNSFKNLISNQTSTSANKGELLLESTTLENVSTPTRYKPSSTRSQSASSGIYTSNPITYEILKNKLDMSNRNMAHIKEQHQLLLKLQQGAKQQLQEMETIRERQTMSFTNNPNGVPDYDNTEEVQNDVETLMRRMKVLTDFIQNQNELVYLLGSDGNSAGSGTEGNDDSKTDLFEEQIQLQQKLNELRTKKQQMASLVNELQNMSTDIGKQSYAQSQEKEQTPIRNVPIDYERIVPIELAQQQHSHHHRNPSHIPVSNGRFISSTSNPIIGHKQTGDCTKDKPIDTNEVGDEDGDEDDIGSTAEEADNSMLSDKIAEINAMKNQLKRLQDMMQTVKLIELKNGDADCDLYDNNSARASRSQSHFDSIPPPIPPPPPLPPQQSSIDNYNNEQSMPKSMKTNSMMSNDLTNQPQLEDNESNSINMDGRVRALQTMTQDLKMQAVSLAAERDRLKDIKNEMFRRRDVVSDSRTPGSSNSINQKIINKRDGRSSSGSGHDGGIKEDDQDVLYKAAYELKKKEFENLVNKLDGNGLLEANSKDKRDHHIHPNSGHDRYFTTTENWRPNANNNNNVSAASSLRSMADHQSMPILKTNQSSGHHQQQHHHHQHHHQNHVPGKDSTDSGAADVLNGISVDAGSLQSGSSRGFSVPPPMRNINGSRDASAWRKRSQETSHISSLHNQHSNFDNLPDGYQSSWFYHNINNNSNYPYNPVGALSPHCPHCTVHHMGGSDQAQQHYCRSLCHQNLHTAHTIAPTTTLTTAATIASGNDPMLLQQFIQTQQMLINSVCQCNQLLWDQQRDINNLNSAVILLQERILSVASNDAMQPIRAESVPPPNVTVCPNVGQTYSNRAQSEQPPNTASLITGCPQQISLHRQCSYPCQNHSFYRNVNINNGGTSNNTIGPIRYATSNTVNGQSYPSIGYHQHLLQQQQQQQHHHHHHYQPQQHNCDLAPPTPNYYQNECVNSNSNNNSTAAVGTANPNNNHAQIFANNFLNNPSSQTQSNIMLNNDLNSPILNTSTSSQCQQSPPPQAQLQPPTSQSLFPSTLPHHQSSIFIHHNNNTIGAAAGATTANNNANINNHLQRQNLAVATAASNVSASINTGTAATTAGTVSSSNAFNASVHAPALNNQVPPGNRANNYWDNFRSYSRQNLLSTNSCKSNEDACSSSNSPHNRAEQNFNQTRNTTLPTAQMTHNNLPTMGGNKYLTHFRNQINQQQQQNLSIGVTTTSMAPPDVLNINQHNQQQQHHSHQLQQQQQQQQQLYQQQQQNNILNDSVMSADGPPSNFSNLNVSGVSVAMLQPINTIGPSSTSGGNCTGAGNFNINTINLELNELKPGNAMKMLPKSSTGGSKRIRQTRESEPNNNLSNNQQNTGCSIDLNLASTVNRPDSKSSAKLFESLKENVYLEVSALIAANESRPHFLINLFRELQLLSTSDPLRNRLMQAFQELYNRYSEPAIQEESSSQSVQNDATPENMQHDSTQSSDNNRYNQSINSIDFPSAESTPVRVPDLHASNDDDDILRTIMLEIAEYLLSVEQINESTLNRITQIAFRYINNSVSTTKISPNINKVFINQDELNRNLHNLDTRNREVFLEGLENYFNGILIINPLINSNGTDMLPQNILEDELYQRQSSNDAYMDLTASVQCKSNEVLSAMRKTTTSLSKDETITLADVVAVIGDHIPANDNEDLAEADQVCTSDDVYSPEEDIIGSINRSDQQGAVGGAGISSILLPLDTHGENGNIGMVTTVGGNSIISTLPDLAKVTATPNNSLEEEALWINEETERMTSYSNLADAMENTNLNNNKKGDAKQKNL